jgi:hypothetical protein
VVDDVLPAAGHGFLIGRQQPVGRGMIGLGFFQQFLNRPGGVDFL